MRLSVPQGVSKESDISKAKATRGCCPDMCPERERYIREERRRVHVYEMVPGTETVCTLHVNLTCWSQYFLVDRQYK